MHSAQHDVLMIALCNRAGELKKRKAAETLAYISDFIADREARRAQQRAADFEEERKIQVCAPAFSLGACSLRTDGCHIAWHVLLEG